MNLLFNGIYWIIRRISAYRIESNQISNELSNIRLKYNYCIFILPSPYSCVCVYMLGESLYFDMETNIECVLCAYMQVIRMLISTTHINHIDLGISTVWYLNSNLIINGVCRCCLRLIWFKHIIWVRKMSVIYIAVPIVIIATHTIQSISI